MVFFCILFKPAKHLCHFKSDNHHESLTTLRVCYIFNTHIDYRAIFSNIQSQIIKGLLEYLSHTFWHTSVYEIREPFIDTSPKHLIDKGKGKKVKLSLSF